MKRLSILKSTLMGMALLLGTTAFASNQGSLEIREAVNINGAALPAGSYHVMWEGNGPDVKMSILKGKHVVATMPAHLVNLQNSPSGDSAVVKKNDDGSRSLAQIRFSGKKYALDVDGATGQGQSMDKGQ